MRRIALQRDLVLHDIDRDVIDGYLGFLSDSGTSTVSQKNKYDKVKAVLKALCERDLVQEKFNGEETTFPRNPFPGIARKCKGATPLPKKQRDAFSIAVKREVAPIFKDDIEPTAYLLVCALLVISLHTGRNTIPLLEMPRDCLRAHPKKDMLFLVLYKWRGHSPSKVPIRDDKGENIGTECLSTVHPTVVQLVRRVIELSDCLRGEAPQELRQRVWLFRKQTSGRSSSPKGSVSSLTPSVLTRETARLVKKTNLVGSDGKPLKINISRLRKTFINRVYDILDGDVVAAAAAAGNTARVTDIHYLRPGEDAQKNWKSMGETLVQELLNNTIGTSEKSPVGRCKDIHNGEYAPKRNGAICMSFLNCVRCRDYVVTGDDLYRLFSFYWRVLAERKRIDPKRWKHQFAHIVRLIDHDIVEAGLDRGVFMSTQVDAERERARINPHPFWCSDSILVELGDKG